MNKVLVTITSRDGKIKAKGFYDMDTGKVTIFKGSNIRDIRVNNYKYFNLRNRLIDSGKIKNSVFQEDIEFDNSNTAAGIILGRNASGKERIKLENGKPLSSIGEAFGSMAQKTLNLVFINLNKEKTANINEHKKNYGKHWKYDAKKFCNESYNYLLSIKPESVTDEDLNFCWKGSFNEYNTLNEVLERMLISTQNAVMKSNVIKYRQDLDRKEKIDKILFGLNAQKILENYTSDSLYETFQKELGINPGMIRKNWSKSIISSCNFLINFKSIDDFKNFIESYDKDVDSRAKLIEYIQHNVYGFGFALTCDFIKELGYTNFCKPDVHIKAVLHGLGICEDKSDVDIFKCFSNLAEKGGFTAYKLDKIIWIICSGKFYNSKVDIKAKIPKHRDEFIKYMGTI